MNFMSAVLACSVRNCGLLLQQSDGMWRCSRGHSFDIARSGYVNLLQPQDRRSLDAGDSAEAVAARGRALASGPGRAILDAFVSRAAAVPFRDGSVVVDLGCGSGDALGALALARRIDAVGIDLSTAAIDAAARRFPALTWVVANGDRRLPLLDGRAALVLSLHGRRNPPECARILESGGHLLVAVPAPDDLGELREAVQGEAVHRDRGESLVDAHAPYFALSGRSVIRRTVPATRGELLDLLRGTYRGFRKADAARLEALHGKDVTLASDVFLFVRRALESTA
jgi:23S rRNA (guanine745-N1)-methyltransferase